jgi:hypothetical protein
MFSFLILFTGIPIFTYRSVSKYLNSGYVPELTFIALTTFIILFFIFFLFGILFDVQENRELHNKL